VLRIGPELIFGRLWKESGIQEAVQSLLEARRYELMLNGPISPCWQRFRLREITVVADPLARRAFTPLLRP
jgi:hypothetical protein